MGPSVPEQRGVLSELSHRLEDLPEQLRLCGFPKGRGKFAVYLGSDSRACVTGETPFDAISNLISHITVERIERLPCIARDGSECDSNSKPAGFCDGCGG